MGAELLESGLLDRDAVIHVMIFFGVPGLSGVYSEIKGALPATQALTVVPCLLEFKTMKTIQSSLLLLAILGMTSVGCSQPAPPATPASEAPAATENAGDAAGSAEKAPAEGEKKEDAGSDHKEG